VTSRVRERVTIAAPVETVFAFFDDVENAGVLVANLVDVTSVEPLENGGRRVGYTTRGSNGRLLEASSEHVEYDPPGWTVTKGAQAGVSIVASREFVATDDGATVVTAAVEWSAPVRYVAKLVEYPLRGPFRRSLRDTLDAAKEKIERRISPS
jgi:uncharacterized membrane protein